MAYIRVDLSHPVINGTKVAFKAPCDCTAVAGLKAYFPNAAGTITNQVFIFADAHGNNLTGVGNLFTTGAIVKAILSIDESKAYLQNADTNQYLETVLAGKAATSHTHTPASIGAAAASHTQAASTIMAGTFPETGVVAKTGTDYGTWRIRNIAAHTDTITAGSTALTNGNIYLQYE